MSGRTACIVGASRGIGLGLARELAGRGYRVFATQRSHSEELAQLANGSEGAVEVCEVDVNVAAAVEGLGQRIGDDALDILVLNAGIYGEGPQGLADLEREAVADIVMTNAVSPTQAAVHLLPRVRRGGTIGMMSSQLGSIAQSSGGTNLYRLSKAAQNMLSRSLFETHASARDIAVLSLHPGWVQTDMGGPGALITVEQSVAGLADRLEEQRDPEHVFVAYDGQRLGW